MMRRFAVGLTAIVVAVALAGFGYREWRQHAGADALSIRGSNGIDEAMFLGVGGIDQWITIRGDDRDNPVLLIVHGGPGQALSPFATWFRSWEKYFTVAQWDQRGAGKTFGRYGDATPQMSMARIVQDGIEVSEYLRRHLHKSKVILLGQSWGSMVGLQMAQARPELFSAYVGTGQAVNTQRAQMTLYESLLSRARAVKDAAAISSLERLGPPPYRDLEGVLAEQRAAAAISPPSELGLYWRLVGSVLTSPRMSLKDAIDLQHGGAFSGRVLYRDLAHFDADRLNHAFATPVFVFQGDLDQVMPPSEARAYVERITAPTKEYLALRGGGHSAFLTMPDEFLSDLVSHVRPLALEPSNGQVLIPPR